MSPQAEAAAADPPTYHEAPPHHPHLTTQTDGVVLASEADAELLAKMGYKQELKRNFTTIEVFGIAFSIMGLLPSIASTLAFSLPAGPGGMVWSWFLASGCIFVVGLSNGRFRQYWWTHYFSSPKTRNYLCFLVGYSNSLGLIGGLCSIDYGNPLFLRRLIVIANDGEWTPSSGLIYVVFMICVITHGVLASTLSKVMGRLQSFSVFMNIALILATIIALPIGRSGGRNDGGFIFSTVQNLTTWPTGWAFMLAWLSPIWTIGAFDSCVMSEEASNAAKAVPMGILMSIGMCWLLGFVIVVVLAACVDPDLSSVLGSSFGQPMAQIYYDAVGKSGAIGFMTLVFIVQYLMGLSIVVAASRQMWAFSRDGALPFSSFFRPISKTFGFIPLRTVWGCVLVALVLGLLCLIAPAAASALFSLAVAANNLAWMVPILSRVVWGQHKFTPAAFYTGRFSTPIAWFAIAFLVFGISLAMFPVGGPNPAPDVMNYTVVVNMTVWGGATVYYFLSARKWFTGPKTTLEEVEGVVQHQLTDEQRRELVQEGLVVESDGRTETVTSAAEKKKE
ncbi:gaba permease [Diplogelasinospora grovesii]|uniref:Gaba permease n=1 Tax=Diplogelasinospora grovesii TaxID=303347 RepID=A0AAN6S174_9PEZI|nr:gaba permease [Diplogelasinospora grovesii]